MSQSDKEAYELRDGNGKTFGVTTVIDHGSLPKGMDVENQKQKHSDDSDSVTDLNDWSGSDQDLTNKKPVRRGEQPWNITVEKSVIQTRN